MDGEIGHELLIVDAEQWLYEDLLCYSLLLHIFEIFCSKRCLNKYLKIL